MFQRFLQPYYNHSFFLFGPRGTGKSTLLKNRFKKENCYWIDLLDFKTEERFSKDPSQLYAIVRGLPEEIKYVIIDEVQKIPRLLDEVHRLIEEIDKIFILTGSSARKLKRGGANLLAGRAFVYHLYSLSCFELGDKFDLQNALEWGTLPKIFALPEEKGRNEFLRSYASTYIKEEIWNEHLIRKLDPFRHFLEVAAQSNGKIINFSNIANDVGADPKTIKEYFSILEDTMIGFFLEPFHNSFRKRLHEKPKFYFFDYGIVRSLSNQLSMSLVPKTFAYGDAFENFIILEFIKLSSYFQPDYRFSYLRTKNDVEIDLLVERPGHNLLCIEIKSSDFIKEPDIISFSKITHDLEETKNCEAIILSQDPYVKKYDHVTCYPWKEGLMKYFPEINQFI